MHIVSHKRIIEAGRDHPNDAASLDGWYRTMKRAEANSFHELRKLFPSVDRVGRFHIFNIAGNNLRLVAAIHFNRQKCYIRKILTHAEYDRWKP